MLSQFNMNVINHLLPAKYDTNPTLAMIFYDKFNDIIFIIMIRYILAFYLYIGISEALCYIRLYKYA